MTAQTMPSVTHADVTEEFDERAAMHEYEAGMKRGHAESLALRAIADKYGKPMAKLCDEWRKRNG